MTKFFTAAVFFCFAILMSGCGGAANTSNAANGGNSANANANAAKPANEAAKSGAGDYYTSVYALKGERMPDDKALVEQKREIANAIHVKYKLNDANKDFNWEERFKDPLSLKFEPDEQIVVITFASAAGKKIEPGEYVATEDADAVKNAPKDKPLAVITLVNAEGAKRLKGKVKITSTEKFILYTFPEPPDVKGLDSMSYGAPFKN